jgi:hypothetical protein
MVFFISSLSQASLSAGNKKSHVASQPGFVEVSGGFEPP